MESEFREYDVICEIGSFERMLVVAVGMDSYYITRMKTGMNINWVLKRDIDNRYVLLERDGMSDGE